MSTQPIYWYAQDRRPVPIHAVSQLLQLIRDGSIAPSTLVLVPPSQDWIEAAKSLKILQVLVASGEAFAREAKPVAVPAPPPMRAPASSPTVEPRPVGPTKSKTNLMSVSGRASRKYWWIYALIATPVTFYVSYTVLRASLSPNDPSAPVLLITGLGALVMIAWSFIAVSIRRLHDMVYGAIWLLAFCCAMVPYTLFSHVLIRAAGLRFLDAEVAFFFMGLIPYIVVFGIKEGTIGPNRYGPDPISRTTDFGP